jgi:predicted glycoside hydrolase/deacetylase ChbG (UPF0249 family)
MSPEHREARQALPDRDEAAMSRTTVSCAPLAEWKLPRETLTSGMSGPRHLLVIADDYGIGPATSRAILELAEEGRVTGAVLLVNSPYAEDAMRAWRQAGQPVELGWHPCLTLDQPILPASRVPSLVRPDGRFWTLRRFLHRWVFGLLRPAEIADELQAQYERFLQLVGRPPLVVNAHQHVQLFPPVGDILQNLLIDRRPLPYLRRVFEPWRMLVDIRGARLKRACLTLLGWRQARRQSAAGFPGNDSLAGITDPRWVENPEFLVRWLEQVPGDVVELACHPGYWDATLVGRDCATNDGLLRRRVCELQLLRRASFDEACQVAGFRRVRPSELLGLRALSIAHAA